MSRFQRTMTTKYNGKCNFCSATTHAGVDMAALSMGKWITLCGTCATSTVAQVRGLVRNLVAVASAANLTDVETAAIAAVIPANLADAMADGAPEAVAYDAIVKLEAVFALIKSMRQDPRIAALDAVAANSAATPKDRDFAGSLANWMRTKGELTPNQAPHADRLIAKYDPATVAVEVPSVKVPEGRYALVDGGVVKFYKVGTNKYGNQYVLVQASDDFHNIRDPQTKAALLAAIAADVAGAAGRYGQEIGKCGYCMHSLTRGYSKNLGYGPDCADRHGLPFDHAAYAASAKVADDEDAA
jgi:hypothetical protein